MRLIRLLFFGWKAEGGGGECKVATPIFNNQATLVTLKLSYVACIKNWVIAFLHSHIIIRAMTTNKQDYFIGWVGEIIRNIKSEAESQNIILGEKGIKSGTSLMHK